MSHRKDKDELWAIVLLDKIIQRSYNDKDALPGSVVKKVKEAKNILKKLRKGR